MLRYWWVNHKQTVREEIEGQYLWSPKTERSGGRSVSYDNMRRASPGDLVLSYANQAIGYVGRVSDYAFTAPKPKEFGAIGEYWQNEGWLLPVFWTALDGPLKPKSILPDLAPLLPERYSPIQAANGNGNQKIYLAEIPQGAFDLVVSNAVFDQFALMRGGSNSLNYEVVGELIDDAIERQIELDITLDETVRRSLVAARRGQGRFRANVEQIERSCRLTGITNPKLLIASHIKPWRACETASERLDGHNGLLLTPDADLLFDRGFITFKDDGAVDISPRIDLSDMRRLGFDHLVPEQFGFSEAPISWRGAGLSPENRKYMRYHREQVFLKAQA